MKKTTSVIALLCMMVCISGSVRAADPAASESANSQKNNVETSMADLSYAFGILFGANLHEMNISELDVESLVKGLKDYREGTSPKLTREEAVALIKKFIAAKQAKIGEENSAKEKEYLLKNSSKKGVRTTESGLQYEVLRESSGKKPVAEDKVKVHYTGSFIDGKVFDSSVERNEPAVFRLNEVIPGWTEGLQLMNTGSKFRFYIPSKLGYGPRGSGAISPNSLLIFDVELLSIEQ
jgi:FKBP-type peptidyl-prolyl cis-trans isomerase FklB